MKGILKIAGVGLKWVAATALFLVGIVLVPLVAATLAVRAMDKESEVDRATSPNGEYDAVLMETNGGATTSYGYTVYIMHSGSTSGWKAASLYGTTVNGAYGANLRWRSSDLLAVEFTATKWSRIEEPWFRMGSRKIHVVLQSGITDQTVPSGHM